MSAFDALKGWPGISEASADELFAHPAWAMPCQWGDERCILRRAAAKPRDVIGIAITLDDDPCFLGLGNRETFPDLHDLWTRKAELPSALILALIETECGDLLQMIENVARRQVGVTGLDNPEKRSGAIAFEVVSPADGSIRASFVLDVKPSVARMFGQLRFLDVGHESLRGMTRPAKAVYATFDLPPEGAAGIAAARAAAAAGCGSICLVDRKAEMGGVLLQCAHHGFGQDLDGPQYTAQLLEQFPQGICRYLGTTVTAVTKDKQAQLRGAAIGRKTVAFNQLILATGCREIPMGALPIAGTRPKGVYTAGQMQEMMNLHGFSPEGPVVILGSGDLGLVMAKHMAERGIGVTLVERRETCGGMAKNQRCLREYPINLHCGTTIIEVLGEKTLKGVKLADGSILPCKTLLIAAGLRPERELVRELENENWLHICGNCHMVHPMVEAVVSEGKRAGFTAYEKIRGGL